MPEDIARPRGGLPRSLTLVLLAAFLAPLAALILSAPAQGAAALCLPIAEQSGCIAGTLRTEAGVLPGVDVVVTPAAGDPETVTTDEDGKWNLQVTEPGEYTVEIDKDTLPDDVVTSGKTTVNVKLGATAPALIEVRTSDYSAESSRFDEILQSAVNGLRLGLLLALASVGLSLIYGTTGLSNFAHAEQVTLGGMVAYGLCNVGGLDLWSGGLLTLVICAATGWIQDRGMWQPLRRRGLGLTQMMIVTIGLSLAAQYCFQYFVGSRTVRVVQDNPEIIEWPSFMDGFEVRLSYQSVVAMGISLVVLAAIGFALLFTRLGRATRAVSDNPALAAASGIDVDKVIRMVWTIAAGLAGLSGMMYALVNNGMKWDSGLQILLLLFAAVTLGGLGTAFGALLGSIVIGLVVELAPALGAPGDLKYASALLILIVLLMVRPQGLLGRAERVG